MSDIIFTLDLTSKNNFTEDSLKETKNKIVGLNSNFSLEVSEFLELSKKCKIEIYAEAIPCIFENPGDLLDLVVEIEDIVGGFMDKSHIEWISEFPHSVKSWEKQGYEWNLVLEEEDDYFDSEDDWREEWENE